MNKEQTKLFNMRFNSNKTLEEQLVVLDRIIDEGKRLASNATGATIHNMIAYQGALNSWKNYSSHEKYPLEIDWRNVDILIRRMRIANSTGIFPKAFSISYSSLEEINQVYDLDCYEAIKKSNVVIL